jgi:DNA-binding MarR family transcriptional regulator
VHLTPSGRQVGATMRDAVTELEAEWSALLGRDQFEHLRILLTRLNEGLADATPSR